MSTISVLNNIEHKELRVNVSKDIYQYVNVNRSVIYVTEVADLHKEFPILISKNADSSEFQLHCILGLEKNENLFVSEQGWTSRFVPALLARGPFSLGYPNKGEAAEGPTDPIICIDMDDPRVGAEDGEELFLPFGGQAPYLDYVKSALKSIELGMKYNNTLFAMVQEFDLLEPVSVNIKLSSSEEVNFSEYFTIDQEKLSKLGATELAQLSTSGVLSVLYFILSSMGNFQHLIDKKDKSSGASA